MSQIVFKVNVLNDAGGFVNRLSTFMHNLRFIRAGYYEELKNELEDSGREQIIRFETAGRYIVTIDLKRDWQIASMSLIDYKTNDNSAKMMIETILEFEKDAKIAEEISKAFYYTYQSHKSKYDENYSLVSLELDLGEFN